HWLAEQALSWSGLPVITMRPTVFLEGFFLLLAAPGVRDADELALPMGGGKTSPISTVDVARAVSVVLDDPNPHIGKIYNLTGFESADLEHYARVFSEALGRTIRYRDVPLSGWSEKRLDRPHCDAPRDRRLRTCLFRYAAPARRCRRRYSI